MAPEKMTDKMLYKCEHCPRIYAKKCLLAMHVRCHTGERPFVCEVCKKGFAQKGDLTRHNRLHTGEKPFQCNQCARAFAHKSNLRQHIACHNEIKPFKCDTCGKHFTRRGVLRQHQRLHNGQTPYECHHCNKTFPRKGALIQHIHQHTDTWPHRCKFCNKGFSDKSHLTNHVRVHSGEKPFKCKYCNRPFSDKSNLNRHHRVHFDKALRKDQEEGKSSSAIPQSNKLQQQNVVVDEEVPLDHVTYRCEHCQRGFALKSNLLKHIRLHTGEKPYTCAKCKKSFSHKSNLSRHMNIHLKRESYKYITSQQETKVLPANLISPDKEKIALNHVNYHSKPKLSQQTQATNHHIVETCNVSSPMDIQSRNNTTCNISSAKMRSDTSKELISTLTYHLNSNKIQETYVAQNVQPAHTVYVEKEVSTSISPGKNTKRSPSSHHSPEHLCYLGVDCPSRDLYTISNKSYCPESQLQTNTVLEKSQSLENQSCTNIAVSKSQAPESLTYIDKIPSKSPLLENKLGTNSILHETNLPERHPNTNTTSSKISSTSAKNSTSSTIHTNAFPYDLSNPNFVCMESGHPSPTKSNVGRNWYSTSIAEHTTFIKEGIRASLQKTDELNATYSKENFDAVDMNRSTPKISSPVYSHDPKSKFKSTSLDKSHATDQTKLSSKSGDAVNLPYLIPIESTESTEDHHRNNHVFIHQSKMKFTDKSGVPANSSSNSRMEYPHNVPHNRESMQYTANDSMSKSNINNYREHNQYPFYNEASNIFHRDDISWYQIQNLLSQSQAAERTLRPVSNYNSILRQHNNNGITTILSWLASSYAMRMYSEMRQFLDEASKASTEQEQQNTKIQSNNNNASGAKEHENISHGKENVRSIKSDDSITKEHQRSQNISHGKKVDNHSTDVLIADILLKVERDTSIKTELDISPEFCEE